MVKNCDRGQHLQAQGHSFSSYGIFFTFINFFSCSRLALQITNGFVYAVLVIQWACAPSTSDLVCNNSDSRQKKDVFKEHTFFELLYISCIYFTNLVLQNCFCGIKCRAKF